MHLYGNRILNLSLKAFISSTYEDLREHRKAVINALDRIGITVLKMETFGAVPSNPLATCYRKIDESDIFIGIYAHRYGYIPSGYDKSFIELEFEYAVNRGKPVFAFIVDDSYPWPPIYIDRDENYLKLIKFKKKIKKMFTIEKFTSPEDLAHKVISSIINYLIREKLIQSPVDITNNSYISILSRSRNLNELLYKSIRIIEDITRTDYNQILLASSSPYDIRLVVVADVISPRKQRYRIATLIGLIGRAYLTGKVLNIGNVHEEPGYFQAVIETRSELVVPIFSNGVVIGVINSESEYYNYFNIQIVKEVVLVAEALGYLLPRFNWSINLGLRELPWVKLNPRY